MPFDVFFSFTVYNSNFFYYSLYNAFSFNNFTSNLYSYGAITIHFGGDPKSSNYLRVMPGWNYTVRLYRPRAELLDKRWKFPQATAVQ